MSVMSPVKPIIVGLGELLWDLFPDGQRLGGAPANFAYHAFLLGNRGIIASRVGNDALGREALQVVNQSGLPTAHIQIDPAAPTGTVQVKLGERGQPDFSISSNVAWDKLDWTPAWQQLAGQADAVCFGSLAQRSPQSRDTIRRVLQSTREDALRIFDVNLRQSFYSAEVLSESLKLANVVKLNEEELPRLATLLGLGGGSQEQATRRLVQEFDLELACVTRGSRGSLLANSSRVVEHPGFQVPVVDTVGSGDAFSAAVAHCLLRKAPLEVVSEAANRLGAWVATKPGATPPADVDVLKQIAECA